MNKHKEANKRYRDNNKDKLKERQRRTRETKPFQLMINQIKHRSKKKGIPYDLDEDHLTQLWEDCDGTCPKTGVAMIKGAHEYTPHSVSIDQINPGKGYTKDNIRLVSPWYNTARRHNTDQLTLQICRHVVNTNTT